MYMSSYEKQGFVRGQALTAAQLNHIEDGIGRLAEEIANIEVESDVYVGKEEPADPSIKVWINPDGEITEPVYELIETITVNEFTGQVFRNEGPDGAPYRLSAVLALIETSENAESFNMSAYTYGGDVMVGRFALGVGSGKTYSYFETETRRGTWRSRCTLANKEQNINENFANPYQAVSKSVEDVPYIDTVRIYNVPAETTITIKGVRA
jgi:hypothetical protein